jgi:opacity protein-like surface antigen
MSRSLIVAFLFALLTAGPAWADDSDPDFGRPGWYVGVGGGVGFDFLEDAVDDFTNGTVDIDPGGSFNARGGYRLASWFALEGMYEGVYEQQVQVAGNNAADMTYHSFLANFKFIAPIWRTHPYIMVGPGIQYGEFDTHASLDGLGLNTTRWDFVLRTAIGLDGYITENWLLNLELAPSIRFADYSNIPSETTDNVTLTVGVGVQYRF